MLIKILLSVEQPFILRLLSEPVELALFAKQRRIKRIAGHICEPYLNLSLPEESIDFVRRVIINDEKYLSCEIKKCKKVKKL